MSKSNNSVLAFDFGGGSGRAILGWLEDGKIRMKEVHRFSNDTVILNGTMYWDTLRHLYEIKQGIVKGQAEGGFRSIGIDTWGVDFGLVDADGHLLESSVTYRDSRTDGMQEEVFSRIGRDRVYEITGHQIDNINTIFQLYSLVRGRKAFLDRAETLLLTPDLFNYFLTGEKKAEFSIASTTQLLDIRSNTWSEEILSALDIPSSLLPEVVAPGTVVGNLRKEICEELGCSPAKVIAVCGHDTASAVAAVPTQEKDFLFASCGTWGLFGTEFPGPVISEKSKAFNISSEGGYGFTTTLLKNITGLWLIQESVRQWQREGRSLSYGELEEMASLAEPLVSFIDPDAPEFTAAGNMPEKIRKYCARTGQKVPESPGEIACTINQSLAMKYRKTLEEIEQTTGKTYPVIHLIGGGIKSKMLCRMTAEAAGRRVVAGPVEATALGNIAVQLIALGEIRDIAEARRIIASSEETAEYFPQNAEKWEEAYARFREIIG
ncbi:MAG: rhamnulokinase [Lachnospiraceae bacterium]|nr:rhamnulokinase [Lachnospiraceae bacterium]